MHHSIGDWRRAAAGLIALAIASAPRAALACPVCFGALEGPVADATYKAVLLLLGVTICVLASFAAFFVYLMRRARAMPALVEARAVEDQAAEDQQDQVVGARGAAPDVDDYMEGAA
jgi:hypothetical protein